MVLTSDLDKFTVRRVGGFVQIAVEVSPGRGGSPRPVVRALTPQDARELARRLNLVAAQALDVDLDVEALPGL
jgi:hypothetical protein